MIIPAVFGTDPDSDRIGVVVKTIVTTELVRKIADDYNVETLDVLTGFRFIGEKIKEFEKSGEYSYIFGLEGSFGYLKGTYARDKDAVVASMLIYEVAAEYKQKGMTLYDALINLYRKYGFCAQKLESVTLKGIDGSAKIQKMMHKFYNHYKVYCYTMFVDADSSINAVKSAESMDKGYCLPSRIDDIAYLKTKLSFAAKRQRLKKSIKME